MSSSNSSRRDPVIRRSLVVGIAAVVTLVAVVWLPIRAEAPFQSPQPEELRFQAAVTDGAAAKPASFMDSRLAQLDEINRRDGIEAARRFAVANRIKLDAEGRVQILIHEAAEAEFGGSTDIEQRVGRTTPGEDALFGAIQVPLTEHIENIGGHVRGRVANLLDADIPLETLRSIEASSLIGFVEPAPLPEALAVAQGSVISQGVAVIQADDLQRSSVSYQGDDDVKVGIIDLGFLGYESLLGSELPASVTVASFSPGGINGDHLDILDQVHGTACAEIVHDVAPDAQLFLANFDSLSENREAVQWMVSQGVDVISYSIGWTNAGPGDGRGPINDAVRLALNAGIEWVGSAGNDARDHWQGLYTSADGDPWHDFAPGDESNAVFLNAGEELVAYLNWDDWFASDQDYDLYIFNDNNEVVAASTNWQGGIQNPTEGVGYVAPVAGNYHVAIYRFSATRDVNLELFFRTPREMQYIVPAGSLTIPADTDGSVAVGATYWADDVIEIFSSQGPTTDGRIKPDLTAPDGVVTRSYGDLGSSFFGTSASAPHVAGAIALMKQRFGVFELEDIRNILFGRAIDRGIAGQDNIYGHGRVDVRGQ